MAIFMAVRNGNLKEVKINIRLGVDVNKQNRNGTTPLIEAAGNGYLEITKYLVKKGANINLRDYDGWSPIMNAVRWHHFDIVKFLVEKGANISHQTRHGITVLNCVPDCYGYQKKEIIDERRIKIQNIIIKNSTDNSLHDAYKFFSNGIDSVSYPNWKQRNHKIVLDKIKREVNIRKNIIKYRLYDMSSKRINVYWYDIFPLPLELKHMILMIFAN